MDNFMKLFAVFVVFIQIQSALSVTPPGSNIVQQLCKKNRYQALCLSTLNLDPRSKTSDLQGLASISLDATTKKTNETLQYFITVFRRIRERDQWELYGTCIEEYGSAIRRFLPAVVADVKAKKYPQAMSNMDEVIAKPANCEDPFAGGAPLAVTRRGKAVHDIADMTKDIIKAL